jgi:hypothetical protein
MMWLATRVEGGLPPMIASKMSPEQPEENPAEMDPEPGVEPERRRPESPTTEPERSVCLRIELLVEERMMGLSSLRAFCHPKPVGCGRVSAAA